MFRANRIGTPILHDANSVVSTVNWTPATSTRNSTTYGYNVINAAPVGDWGRTNLNWIGGAGEVIGADLKYALVQQFTVQQPLNGNTVGIEINGHLQMEVTASVSLIPVFMRLDAALGSTLAGASTGLSPTQFGNNNDVGPPCAIAKSYTQQFIIRDTTLQFGTYAHGYYVYDRGSGHTLNAFMASLSVRQFNELQTQQSRDPLR